MNTITRRKISQADIEFVKTHYPTKGGRYCAIELNRTINAIHAIARKYNFMVVKETLPSIFETIRRKSNSEYNVNADYFMTPTNPSVVYTMGLLWADGTINTYKNTLRSVSLKSTYPDGDEFYKIMSSFGKWNYYKYKVKTSHYTHLKPSIQIQTNNRPLVEYLTTLGYTSKSIVSAEAVLNTIPSNLQHYWFRGLFDGDGSLYVKGRTIQVVLAGPHEQDWSYLTNLLNNLRVSYSENKVIAKKGKSSYVRLTGANNCKKFLDYIYQNSEKDGIYLSRKHNKYLSI